MQGTKPTIRFWRARRPLLSLERALTPLRQLRGKSMIMVPAPATARARLQREAMKKGRFAEE